MMGSRIIILLCVLTTVSVPAFAQEKSGFIHGNAAYDLSVVERRVLLRKAHSGNGEAAFRMSMYYGLIKSDQAEARKWQCRAAELGHPIAQYNMGVDSSENQDPVIQKKALYWYKRAARSGHILALKRIAELYEQGKGVPKSYKHSRKWYKRAAKLGSNRAMQDLAKIYVEGRGVPKSYKRAREWYRKAAMNASFYAMMKMVEYFAEGTGGDKDNVRAAAWLLLAMDRIHSGTPSASARWRVKYSHEMADRLTQLESKMTPVEIEQSKTLYEKLKKEVPFE